MTTTDKNKKIWLTYSWLFETNLLFSRIIGKIFESSTILCRIVSEITIKVRGEERASNTRAKEEIPERLFAIFTRFLSLLLNEAKPFKVRLFQFTFRSRFWSSFVSNNNIYIIYKLFSSTFRLGFCFKKASGGKLLELQPSFSMNLMPQILHIPRTIFGNNFSAFWVLRANFHGKGFWNGKPHFHGKRLLEW